MNLNNWLVFESDDLICIYQLILSKDSLDVKFDTKIIIDRNLQVRVLYDFDNENNEHTLVELFTLNSWQSLDNILQYSAQKLDVKMSQTYLELNDEDEDEVIEETIQEPEYTEEIYLVSPKNDFDCSNKKEMVFYKDNSYCCEICDAIFSTELKYEKHLQNHTFITEKCPTCEKIFDDLKKFNKHQSICQVERKYLCDICCMKFKNKTALNSHLIRHNLDNKVPCTICGVKFFPG